MNRMPPNQLNTILSKYPHLLFFDNLPDTSALNDCMPPIQGSQGYQPPTPVYSEDDVAGIDDDSIPSVGEPLPTAFALAMADSPERWIDYTSADVVCVSIDQFAALAQKYPAAYRAILDWTDAGGNLWICGLSGAEGDWSRLPEMDRLLRLSVRKSRRKNQRTIHPQRRTLFTPRVRHGHGDGHPGGSLFRQCEVEEAGLEKLLVSIGPGRWRWNLRHGMNLGQGNADFWNFLIPGVGLAPVRTFQVFITLFVLGIGPLNYWLLRRRKRLHLMVLTVPLSAAVVTALLFGYALVADGLGTRVRVRSVTRLDSQRGRRSPGRGSRIMPASRLRRA